MTNAPHRIIRLNPKDNIGIALADLGTGSVLPSGAVTQGRIKRENKVALAAAAPGAPVYRYVQMIGTASEAIMADNRPRWYTPIPSKPISRRRQ